MRSITLIGKDGSEFLVGVVPASFNIDAWAKQLTHAFVLLQIKAVQVRDVALA